MTAPACRAGAVLFGHAREQMSKLGHYKISGQCFVGSSPNSEGILPRSRQRPPTEAALIHLVAKLLEKFEYAVTVLFGDLPSVIGARLFVLRLGFRNRSFRSHDPSNGSELAPVSISSKFKSGRLLFSNQATAGRNRPVPPVEAALPD